MARPRKAAVEYFPHMVTHGRTMFVLEQRYGNDGYAFWFKLLEFLGATEGHIIDCGNPVTREFLIAKTRMTEGFCDDILDLLALLEAIDRDLWREHRLVWCQKFVDGIADVYRKRRVSVPLRPDRVSASGNKGQTGFPEREPPQGGDTDSDNRLPSRERKVKESKGEKVPLVEDSGTSSTAEAGPSKEGTQGLLRRYTFESEEYRLALRLREGVRGNFPGAAVPPENHLDRWADTIRLLMQDPCREQKPSPEAVGAVIDWCQNDDFWRTNIRSATNLRKHYDTLVIRAGEKATRGPRPAAPPALAAPLRPRPFMPSPETLAAQARVAHLDYSQFDRPFRDPAPAPVGPTDPEPEDGEPPE